MLPFSIAVHVSEDCYAMVDSGTTAVIVPLHPDMCGETAECKVPSSIVHGPTVQTLDFKGQSRLVVALPQSVILIFQGWQTTVAHWKTVAQPKGTSSQVVACTANAIPSRLRPSLRIEWRI